MQNYKTFLRMRADEFDLVKKAISKFGCSELRVEQSNLVLRDTFNELAVVDLDLFLGRKVPEDICIHLPKGRLNTLNLAKTNGDIEFRDMGTNYVAIVVGDFSAGYGRILCDCGVKVEPNPLRALSLTNAQDLGLHRKLVSSLSRNSNSSMYVHTRGKNIVSLGTGEGAIDYDGGQCWVEETDIVVNANARLVADCPETSVALVREGRKHFVLLEYVLDEGFRIRHFIKCN